MFSLGERIRELRLKKGLTQIDLSKELCTPSMISQIESDRARPSYKILMAIAERLDVSLDKLLVDVNLDMEHTSKYRMAMAMIQAKEFKSAIPLLEELLENNKTQVAMVDILFELGTCYLEVGQDLQALHAFEQVLEMALLREDHQMIASVMLNIGLLNVKKKEFQIALYHTTRALEELQKFGQPDPTLQAKMLFQLASINQEIGKADEAIRYYQEALSVYKSSDDLEGIGKTFLCLSENYQKRKDYEKSTEYATLALSILKTYNHINAYQDVQRQLILLERSRENWETAVEELQQFADTYESQGDWQRASETYADIANVYFENRIWDKAEVFARKVLLVVSTENGALGKAHQLLALISFECGDSEAGRKHLDNAMAIFERLGLLQQMEKLTLLMCQYLDKQGNYEEAFKRLEKFHGILANKLEERGILL